MRTVQYRSTWCYFTFVSSWRVNWHKRISTNYSKICWQQTPWDSQ